MGDPFLPGAGGEGSLQREVQRLMQENKELRERSARLLLQAETASASSRGGGGGLVREARRRGRPPAHDADTDGDRASSSATKPGGGVGLTDDNNSSTGGDAALMKGLREQLAREVRARQEAESQLRDGGGSEGKVHALKRQFEAFVNATCEREQVYKLVYAGVSAELAERRQLTERLQMQIQEMRKQHQAALERASAMAPATSASVSPPPPPSRDVGALEKRLAELEKHIAQQQQQQQQASDGQPPAKKVRGSRKRAIREHEGNEPTQMQRGADGDVERDSLAEEPVGAPNDGGGNNTGSLATATAPAPTAESLVIAQGAGELRNAAAAAVAAERALRKERQRQQRKTARAATAAVRAAPVSGVKRGRGRPEGDEDVAPSSLFANFSSMTAHKTKRDTGTSGEATTGGSSVPSAAPLEAVRFGADPVGEYVSLMRRTAQRPHRVLLGRKLLGHLHDSPAALAELVVARHRDEESKDGAKLEELWKEVEWVLEVSDAVFPCLCEALTTHLTATLGPDTAASHLPTWAGEERVTEGLRTVATVLRLAHVHWARRGHRADNAALQDTFLEVVVSTLRRWRYGRTGSPMGDDEPSAPTTAHPAEAEGGVGPDGAVARRALSEFCAVASALWGGGATWAGLVRFHNAGEVDDQLRLLPAAGTGEGTAPSLAVYTAQALLPLCLVRDAAGKSEWLALCDAIGWSGSQIPVQPLADAAVLRAATSADGIRCLRLLTLYRGFGHLQSLMEGLRSLSRAAPSSPLLPGTGSSSSSSVSSDAVFAKVVSFAVMDLGLQDTRDEQWQRTIAFLHDYLVSSGEAEFNSAEEFVWAATDAHVLAVRAILELYRVVVHLPAAVAGGGFTSSDADPTTLFSTSSVGGGDGGADVRSTVDRYVASAMAWVAAQRAALAVVERRGRAPPEHPLTRTALGQMLLSALPPLTHHK